MNEKIATIFGGSGFLGRHLVRKLTEKEYRVIVATRSPYLSGFLKPLGNPGQIELVKTNIYDEDSIRKILKKSDIAINLVGILSENKKQKFEFLHSEFTKLLAKLCAELNLKKLIHISALGVKENHTSKYMQSKFLGEKNIINNFDASIILRPSIIFGPEDKFFNTFASIAQFSPILPLIGGGHTKFEPVYVNDVAEAIVRSIELNIFKPTIYELGGPSIYSFKELLNILLKTIKKKRLLVPIPFSVARLNSYFLQMMPNPLLTPDQVELLKYDNIASGQFPNLNDLDIYPSNVQSILPKYIYRFRTGGQFG